MFSTLPRRRPLPAIAALAIVGFTASCGSADAPDAAPTTDAPTGNRQCETVNADLESTANQVIAVGANDFAFDRLEYEADTGTITFTMTNNGEEEHELAFLPGGGEIPLVDGEPDEDALAAAGAFELEAFGRDQSCNATYELEAGTYTLFCIVRSDDGVTHYDKGMKSTLVVT